MPGFVAVNSSQMKKVTKGWVAVDGQMKEITKGWVYENGNWKQIFDKNEGGAAKTLGDLEIGTVVLVEEIEKGYAEWRIVANAGDHYYSDENGEIPVTGMKVLMREKPIGSSKYMAGATASTSTYYSNQTLDHFLNDTPATPPTYYSNRCEVYIPAYSSIASRIQIKYIKRWRFAPSARELGGTSGSDGTTYEWFENPNNSRIRNDAPYQTRTPTGGTPKYNLGIGDNGDFKNRDSDRGTNVIPCICLLDSCKVEPYSNNPEFYTVSLPASTQSLSLNEEETSTEE